MIEEVGDPPRWPASAFKMSKKSLFNDILKEGSFDF